MARYNIIVFTVYTADRLTRLYTIHIISSMRKDKEPIPDFHEVKVKLKNVFGIKPVTYVPLVYIVVVVLILFFLLIYPGIRFNGALVHFTSIPDKAVVKIDGKYMGSTPVTGFVKSGERTVEITKPFYKTYLKKTRIKGRIFGTLFFPVRQKINAKIEIADLHKIIQWKYKDFVQNPFIPQILTDTVSSLYSINNLTSEQDVELKDFLYKSMYFIQTEEGLRYFIKACNIYFSNGGVLTSSSLVKLAENIGLMNENYPLAAFWFTVALKDKNAVRIIKSQWFKDKLLNYISSVNNFKWSSGIRSHKSINFKGMTFAYIPEASFLLGNTTDKERLTKVVDPLIPVPVTVKSFYILNREISRADYRLFLKENPSWRKSNIEELMKKGLAEENYLKTFPEKADKNDNLPVTYVSFYAATAYAQWLTDKIKTTYPRYRARLPLETEWEWAARGGIKDAPYPNGNRNGNYVFFKKGRNNPEPVKSSIPNGFGLYDISGNVWEWCGNWYSPVSYFLSPLGPSEGAEKAVRGGGWANLPELSPLYQRGSQPPSWCTDYLGFRVVLAKE